MTQPKSQLLTNAAATTGRHFQPARWLRSGHAQTVLASWLTSRRELTGTQLSRITMPDGDQLVLHENTPDRWQPTDPTVLLFHGLCGCHRSPYLVRIVRRLLLAGVKTYRLDWRGCGAGQTLARWPYHAGRSEDAQAAFHAIAERHPQSPIAIVGYSLGGNILLKMAAESTPDAARQPTQIIAVNPPIDLKRCVLWIHQGVVRFYERYFLRLLITQTAQRWRARPTLPRVPLQPRPRTIYEFDDRVTAPLAGFASADDYYARSSTHRRLGEITIPTTIFVAADDPVIPWESFHETPASPAVRWNVTAQGGHLGFFSANRQDRWWIDQQIASLIIGCTTPLARDFGGG